MHYHTVRALGLPVSGCSRPAASLARRRVVGVISGPGFSVGILSQAQCLHGRYLSKLLSLILHNAIGCLISATTGASIREHHRSEPL